ncbi:MAG: glycerol-3-phosphate dehydrogenase [Desulfobulbaceae bacterium]|uniref:Glycerol-3-phosphate dehydrogenase n=1 Tax=Candidatus Desulfatifera sulfidica TaxID=2841691 RepID=A0A8J6NBB2_9BACT|nr:glycerol-3-phosphate dehydrogenase [Candidatus Desulfatifera sulfidica]
MTTPVYDLAIIGGGINGCGIARDAAGRGLSVFLCEQNDLASGTSSASTNLIHGGLRYLEYYEFRLVREALREREVLLNAAPHIIWPLRFILPHHKGLRPAWLIRLGLFLYDHIGGRKLLPGTTSVNLTTDEAGRPLKGNFSKGFEYSDCWVMDSRLVVLNAMDAAEKGADIRVQTPLLSAERVKDIWVLKVLDKNSGEESTLKARVLVNASGPWMDTILPHISHSQSSEHVRMVKGSHIIVNKLFEHDRAYIFQNKDGRIIFSIPYVDKFTLIGTTDVDFHGNPDDVEINSEEIDYLCQAASEYFTQQVTPESVVSSYSGIRPLFDDGKSDAKAITRDYVLKLDTGKEEAPLMSIYGGKITTYRKLAESVLDKLAAFLPPMKNSWTEAAKLPGGDFEPSGFAAEVRKLRTACPVISESHASRLVRTYGTCAHELCLYIQEEQDMGVHFGHQLYAFEVDYLILKEWAQSTDDILWRRTKIGLHLNEEEVDELAAYIQKRGLVCGQTTALNDG